jgi:hypothetical protein
MDNWNIGVLGNELFRMCDFHAIYPTIHFSNTP